VTFMGMFVPEEIGSSKKLPCMGWCKGRKGLEGQADIIRSVGDDPTKIESAMKACLEQGTQCKCSTCSSQLLKLSEALSFHGGVLAAKSRRDHEGLVYCAEQRGKLYRELGHVAI